MPWRPVWKLSNGSSGLTRKDAARLIFPTCTWAMPIWQMLARVRFAVSTSMALNVRFAIWFSSGISPVRSGGGGGCQPSSICGLEHTGVLVHGWQHSEGDPIVVQADGDIFRGKFCGADFSCRYLSCWFRLPVAGYFLRLRRAFALSFCACAEVGLAAAGLGLVAVPR